MFDSKTPVKKSSARRFGVAAWLLVVVFAAALVFARLAPGSVRAAMAHLTSSSESQGTGVDTGTPLDGTPAPDFTLIDQFGRQHRLSDFRGKVVALAFIDSRCTDTCPLTAEMLRMAKDKVGARANQVQLLAVNANPVATSVQDVRSWSDSHDMTTRWLFLTGPEDELKKIWAAYYIEAEVEPNGDVTHTPAVYLIDPAGREQFLFLGDSNAGGVADQANAVAQDVMRLLPS